MIEYICYIILLENAVNHLKLYFDKEWDLYLDFVVQFKKM